MNNYFSHLIGQENVKKKLNFYIKAYQATSVCPFLNLVGAKGLGKTLFAKEFAKQLNNKDGSKRPFLELNCSTIKNNAQFFEQIFIPLVMNNEITILFDEAHALPKDLTMAFLTIFNTEKTNTKEFVYDEQTFTFDFTKQTFIFATTESDKLFPPLKDRLSTVDFEQYSEENLGEIIKLNCEGINFTDESLKMTAKTVRGNARNAVMRSREIVLYCESENKNSFEVKDYESLTDLLGILPHGITCTERQILEILSERGSCKLQTLSAVTGLSPTSLRRDHEVYLLRNNFMQIDGERKITNFGKQLIQSI
ncbi:MAG: AAA family ATPase [Actinomycetota bacterium]|jgi:Holliday junction resolvasome RuvABC ATP-dependent DNA helicase subunit|nr:AAA family ATPase [Actinomycetota bacterium]